MQTTLEQWDSCYSVPFSNSDSQHLIASFFQACLSFSMPAIARPTFFWGRLTDHQFMMLLFHAISRYDVIITSGQKTIKTKTIICFCYIRYFQIGSHLFRVMFLKFSFCFLIPPSSLLSFFLLFCFSLFLCFFCFFASPFFFASLLFCLSAFLLLRLSVFFASLLFCFFVSLLGCFYAFCFCLFLCFFVSLFSSLIFCLYVFLCVCFVLFFVFLLSVLFAFLLASLFFCLIRSATTATLNH
jgi:hypothetical protein